MKKRLIISLIFVLAFGANLFAQDDDLSVERNKGWKEFSRKNFDKIDFTKKKITKAQIGKLNSDGAVDELALLRGIVFGKRGRVFKERTLDSGLSGNSNLV